MSSHIPFSRPSVSERDEASYGGYSEPGISPQRRASVVLLAGLVSAALILPDAAAQAPNGVPGRSPLVRSITVRDADIRDVLRMISTQTGVNIVADESVRGTLTINLNEVTVQQALETLLAVKGLYSYQAAPNIFLISTKPLGIALKVRLSDDKTRISLECKDVELKDLFKELGLALGKTLVADPSVQGKATMQIGSIPIDEALSLIAVSHGLSIARTQNAYVFQKSDASRPQRPLPFAGLPSGQVSLDVVNANLEECLQALTAQSGVNIQPLAPMTDKVSVRFTALSLEEALKLLLSGTKYTYRKMQGYPSVAAAPEKGKAPRPAVAPMRGGCGSEPVEGTARSTQPTGGDGIISLPYYLVGDASNLTGPGAGKLVRTAVFTLSHVKPEELPKALSPIVPATTLKVLKEQNAVAITGTEDVLRRVREEIDLLDVAVPQVMIEAMILETSANLDKTLGLSIGAQEGTLKADTSNGTVIFDSSSALAQKVTATLKALVSKGKAKVLAHPKIATQSGREAMMDVGQTRYFRTGILSTGNGGGNGGGGGNDPVVGGIFLPQQITTIQVGILLKIIPYVGSNGEITVDLSPQVDDITGVSTEGLPEVSRRRAQTTLRVQDGETIMLGGLKREEVSRQNQAVPLLGRIPLLGLLFQRNQTIRRESELVMLITPRILRPGPFFQETPGLTPRGE